MGGGKEGKHISSRQLTSTCGEITIIDSGVCSMSGTLCELGAGYTCASPTVLAVHAPIT